MKDHYKNKYLKYKNKYLNLKAGVNIVETVDNTIPVTIQQLDGSSVTIYVTNTDTIRDLTDYIDTNMRIGEETTIDSLKEGAQITDDEYGELDIDIDEFDRNKPTYLNSNYFIDKEVPATVYDISNLYLKGEEPPLDVNKLINRIPNNDETGTIVLFRMPYTPFFVRVTLNMIDENDEEFNIENILFLSNEPLAQYVTNDFAYLSGINPTHIYHDKSNIYYQLPGRRREYRFTDENDNNLLNPDQSLKYNNFSEFPLTAFDDNDDNRYLKQITLKLRDVGDHIPNIGRPSLFRQINEVKQKNPVYNNIV